MHMRWLNPARSARWLLSSEDRHEQKYKADASIEGETQIESARVAKESLRRKRK
jgi:hypothetical protein